jgi:hypothetical protein
MILDAKKFSKSSDGTLVVEISELQLRRAPASFTLVNFPKDGQHRSFHPVGVDESGGDVAGWRYEQDKGPNCGHSWEHGHPPVSIPVGKVLIIND